MLEERVFKRVRVAILQMQKTSNVEIIGNAASRECAYEEHDVQRRRMARQGTGV